VTLRRDPLSAQNARPLMLHSGWIFIAGGIAFLVVAGVIFLVAMYRSLIEGANVPWTDFAVILTAMGGAAGTILGIVLPLLRDRRIQRVEEIRAGVPPSSPLPSGPPEGGPRPQESIPP
jgi:hypothetical protein